MQNTNERLEDILDSIEHQNNVLDREYAKIKANIKTISVTGRDTTQIVQQLKDNLSSREDLYAKIRQTYKDSVGIR